MARIVAHDKRIQRDSCGSFSSPVLIHSLQKTIEICVISIVHTECNSVLSSIHYFSKRACETLFLSLCLPSLLLSLALSLHFSLFPSEEEQKTYRFGKADKHSGKRRKLESVNTQVIVSFSSLLKTKGN